MIAAVKYVWARFVAWLMLRTFDVTPEEVLALRRVRIENDRLFVRLQQTCHELGVARRDAVQSREATEEIRDRLRRYVTALSAIANSRTHRAAVSVAMSALRKHDAPTLRRIPIVEVESEE